MAIIHKQTCTFYHVRQMSLGSFSLLVACMARPEKCFLAIVCHAGFLITAMVNKGGGGGGGEVHRGILTNGNYCILVAAL